MRSPRTWRRCHLAGRTPCGVAVDQDQPALCQELAPLSQRVDGGHVAAHFGPRLLGPAGAQTWDAWLSPLPQACRRLEEVEVALRQQRHSGGG
eukprot:scaffold11173_cov101-Isochrysis_galbana.AAC.2